uniref:Leucine-rich PPR motif-containing protein, mitochondrial n=1 Tax=Strongyloides papillosus TaxID=174720 RepID=A0A0N5BJ41_STREA
MFRTILRNNFIKRNAFRTQMFILRFEGTQLTNSILSLDHHNIARKDDIPVNRRYFNGEMQSKDIAKNQNCYNPEDIYKKFYEKFSNHVPIKGSEFISQILVPLEKGDVKLIKLIKSDDNIMSFLISLCGKVMNDIDTKNKNIILNRLCAGLEKNNFNFSLKVINAKLKVLSENDVYFDVRDTLYDLEEIKKLVPDEKFINLMINQLAKCGRKEELENFIDEIVKKGYSYDDKSLNLAMIRCVSVKKMYIECNKLIENFKEKFGVECEKEALYQVLLSTSQQLDLPTFNKYLKRLSILKNDDDNTKHFANLERDVIFDIIWNLGLRATSKNEMIITNLIRELLSYVSRDKGFIKLFYLECQRHITEEYYYTATAMICDASKKSKTLTFLESSKYFSNLSRTIFNKMVENSVNEEKMKYIANRLAAFTGFNYCVFNDLAYSVLTSKTHKSYEKLDMILSFINDIDPDRERYHLIFPILVGEKHVNDKLQLLYRWKNAGYNDLTKLNIYLINKYIITPFLENRNKKFSDFEELEKMKKIFKTYNIEETTTWTWMSNLKNTLKSEGPHHDFPISIRNIDDWLKNTYDDTLNNKIPEEVKENELINKLGEYVEDKNFDKIHILMTDTTTYRKIDVSPYVDKILELYLQFGYWGQIMTFLTNISNYCRPIDDREDILTSEQILKILQRFILTTSDITKFKELLYDIKKKFPSSTLESQNSKSALDETKKLIQLFFHYNKEKRLSIDDINNIQVILTTLYQLDIIDLPTDEAITPFFVEKVLNHCGWNTGVKMWIKFQSQLLCSNSLISLFIYALGDFGDRYQLNYIMLKAQSYMTKSRVDAFYLGALSSTKQNTSKINDIVNSFDSPMKASDVLHVFGLLNSLSKKSNQDFCKETFLEVSLKNTDLIKKRELLNLLVNNCLVECERKNLGLLALKYQNIFTKYGYEFNEEQSKRVTNLNLKSDELFDKWIFNKKTGVLNVH